MVVGLAAYVEAYCPEAALHGANAGATRRVANAEKVLPVRVVAVVLHVAYEGTGFPVYLVGREHLGAFLQGFRLKKFARL